MRSRNCVVEWLSCDELTSVRALAQTDCNPLPPPICVVLPPCICSVGQTMALSHLQAAPTHILKRIAVVATVPKIRRRTPVSRQRILETHHNALSSVKRVGLHGNCTDHKEDSTSGQHVLGCPHQANMGGLLPSDRGFFYGGQKRI